MNIEGLKSTDGIAVLDTLVPDPEWETELALFSSYSVDLIAVAAIVEALGGEGSDHELMRNDTLARACERMRDRFRVICQAGRVYSPKNGTNDLVIADRWIREVYCDGNEKSWHAKLALIKYVRIDSSKSEVEWRLWCGSRNLTRDTSWDSAILAIGKFSETCNSIDKSVAKAGFVLAEKAELPNWPAKKVKRQLERIHWSWPSVLQVLSFSLWPDAQPPTGFPKPPEGLKHILAVSPFLNASVAKRLSEWGECDTQRQLLTNRNALLQLRDSKSQPLAGFSGLHYLGIPDHEDIDERDHDDDDESDEGYNGPHRGLHAKLLLARSESTDFDQVWLGSANLTERGWNGSNTELVIHGHVTAEVSDGLLDSIVSQLAIEIDDIADLDTDESLELTDDPVKKKLDDLRNEIAANWKEAKLVGDEKAGKVSCHTTQAPLLNNDVAELQARLLGQKNWISWQPNTVKIQFPWTTLHRRTELVELILRSTKDPDKTVPWVARAVSDPPLTIERDRAVLARLMGPKAFLLWLSSMLGEIIGQSPGNSWPKRMTREPKNRGAASYVLKPPTIESVLRTWVEDQKKVRSVDNAMKRWDQEIKNIQRHELEPDDKDAQEELIRFQDELRRFREIWLVIRKGLRLT